ncbi:fcp1 [Symbiodinium sp. CCMP2592]|nr:fcp1 [Symbiodinium sp. CCMP2592]
MAESDGGACAHDVTFAGMCCQCYRIVSAAQEEAKAMQRPGFLTTSLDLQVSESLLSSLDADEQIRRSSERKLVLVMDLDHTLVTADIRSFPSKMKIRKRPGVDDFLQATRDTCEIYVYTQATGAYAQKDLSQILPKDATSALIVDDREEVWPVVVRESQLLKVIPYLPFEGDARQHLDFEGKLTGAIAADPSTAALPWSEFWLWLAVFLPSAGEDSTGAEGRSVASSLPSLRSRTLQGCRLCLTGFFRSDLQWPERLGAKLVTAPENATHVVAARRTEKWFKALALQQGGGLSIVHPGWLLYAVVTWRRPCEEKFPFPKEGSCKSFLDIWGSEAPGPEDSLEASKKGSSGRALVAAEMEALVLQLREVGARRDLAWLDWVSGEIRQRRFQLKPAVGEHPCFAGFTSMIQDSGRCGGWQRTYPEVGQKRAYLNVGMGRRSEFTLEDLVAAHINVWAEEGSTDLQRDVAVKAAEIYANVHNVDELKPAAGSASWMEHECKVMGEMPFMYTCSNRINVLLQRCGFDNAFVMAHDFLVNFPGPVNNKSSTNADIIFYLCQELVDVNPNPYHVANTFAHELAHVIQGGFGTSTTVMMEGGATWLEGSLLNLAPRPMVYAWGFRDWNRINAAHIYAQTKRKNARKFYQIHAMLLTYLSQAELLGDFGASALQNYQVFSSELLPFGRNTYDYYFHYVGQSQPQSLETLHMDAGRRIVLADSYLADVFRTLSSCRL